MLGTMTKQLPNSFYGKMEGQLMGALDYHPRIFDAIVAGNAKTARALMSEHIISGGDILVAHLEEEGIWGGEHRRTRGAGRAAFLETAPGRARL